MAWIPVYLSFPAETPLAFVTASFTSVTCRTIVYAHLPMLKGIQFILDTLAPQVLQAKNAKPEQFVDLSFSNEVEKEGFFTEVAKRYPAK